MQFSASLIKRFVIMERVGQQRRILKGADKQTNQKILELMLN